MGGSCVFNCCLGLYGCRDHVLQDDLQSHRVAAALMGKEELAIALEFAVVETELVTVVVSMESDLKLIEVKAIALLSVTLGFLDLAYHSIIHWLVSFQL